MATFVIHALGEPPKKAAFSRSEIKIGRVASCDLVLPSKTVSRQHALVGKGPQGSWTALCLSETNPLVVNGTMTRTEVEIQEGTEILLGGDFLLIFVEEDKNAASFMGGEKKYYVRFDCGRCGWGGLMSGVRAEPACPGCGGVELKRQDAYDSQQAAGTAEAGSTSFVDRSEVRRAMEQLKTAKMSHVERIDGKAGTNRKELTERDTLTISKSTTTGLKLHGIVLGKGIKVSWNGQHFLAESDLSFPSMKINGKAERMVRLKNGDLIDVGSNRFRFATE